MRFTADTQPVGDRPGERRFGKLRTIAAFRGSRSSEDLITEKVFGNSGKMLFREMPCTNITRIHEYPGHSCIRDLKFVDGCSPLIDAPYLLKGRRIVGVTSEALMTVGNMGSQRI